MVVAGFGIALVTGLATGIAPALQATRTGALPALKDESAGAGTRRTRLREGLIVVQVAVSVLLLAASGLVVRSFLMVHRGPGFDPDAIAMLRLRPSLVGYSAERAWAFQREVIRRLESIPGVIAASPANIPPLPGVDWPPTSRFSSRGIRAIRRDAFRAATTPVGPRYFKTLGVPLVEGREFDDRDRIGGPRVAIVNETLARHFWPEGRAVGQLRDNRRDARGDRRGREESPVHQRSFSRPSRWPISTFWQQDTTENWTHDSRTHVRVAGDAAAMLPQIQRAIAAVDADVPVSEVQSLGARLDAAFSDVRAARAFLVIFGTLTLVLSAIGLYAALAFAVGQRTREIAIRMALGAARFDVGRLVLQRGAAIVLVGVSIGLVAAALAGPLLAHLLYGVSPRDPLDAPGRSLDPRRWSRSSRCGFPRGVRWRWIRWSRCDRSRAQLRRSPSNGLRRRPLTKCRGQFLRAVSVRPAQVVWRTRPLFTPRFLIVAGCVGPTSRGMPLAVDAARSR